MSYYHYKRNITIAELPMEVKKTLERTTVGLFEKAKVHIQNGKFEDAIEILDELLETQPQITEVWCNKAAAYLYWGVKFKEDDIVRNEHIYNDCFRKSHEAINEALDLNKRVPVFWLVKGSLMLEIASFRVAEDCFTKALKLNKKFAPAWIGKARAHYLIHVNKSKDEIKKAMEYADAAIMYDEKSSEAWLTKALILDELERRIASEKCIQKAAKLAIEQNIKDVLNQCLVFARKRGFKLD
ncbi:TPA: hypothetical protein H1009_01010 [archaeon]|nr:hypothetical protein [Candidatus Naiadarchaeales archaeon SRR2090153.bin461]